MSGSRFKVKVAHRNQEAEGIVSYELVSTDDVPLPSFTAGSHIDILMPNGIVRQYSLCNSPAERHRYLIAVLREPDSRGGSSYMHDEVEEGCLLEVSGPRNLFPLNPDAEKSLLFAGGIGITPILGMAESLALEGADFEMHYATRSLSRTAFRSWFDASPYAKSVHLHLGDGPSDQQFDAEKILREHDSTSHVYVCGPAGFIDHVLDTAKKLGWEGANLHREYFSAGGGILSAGDVFEIEIASSGEVYEVPAARSVVDVLAEHGIDIPVACQQGVCGTCITRLKGGEPDHQDQVLSEAEHLKNDRFTPCCSRAKSRRLILDL